ncbi:inositol monophosphatase 2 isoform X1 [Oryx dammah]|uniref:inositol monophosphatase 2 isoform X1 n=1 Tax=Oryx dammah TaxID=59534 RepID=UPI001A9B8A16|nr:inositol monophosphatase 2 isoform X1 [Oryx dammah]
MKASGEDGEAPAGGPWEECFEAAVQLALRAGQIIRKALSEEKRVSTKTSAADLVTETDHVVEALILQELQTRFPSHRFIAEEAAAAGAKCVLTPSPTWIVDPIDGTCNFVHRFPTVAVSIGFAVNQELEFGVIYHCTEERLYTGRRGQGAFCNGQQLRVSGETDPSEFLHAMHPWNERTGRFLRWHQAFLRPGRPVQGLGSNRNRTQKRPRDPEAIPEQHGEAAPCRCPRGSCHRQLHPGALPPGCRHRRRLLPVWPALLGPGRSHSHHQGSRGHCDGHVRWTTGPHVMQGGCCRHTGDGGAHCPGPADN